MTTHLEDLRESLLDARVDSPFDALRDALAQDDDLLEQLLPALAPNVESGQTWHVFATAFMHLLSQFAAQSAEAAGALDVVRNPEALKSPEVYAQLRGLCVANMAALRELLQRPNQSSAPERAAVFFPALCEISELESGAALHLIEIGPGMGFNLCTDKFRYDYGALGIHGAKESPCLIQYTIAGSGTESIRALFSRGFRVHSRTGLEQRPVDPADDSATAWNRSFLGSDADQNVVDRALETRRATPIDIVPGDAANTLGPAIARLQSDGIVCVLESYVAYQLPAATRTSIEQILTAAAAGKNSVYLISLGRFSPRGGRLSIFQFARNGRRRRTAGYVNGFGNVGDTLTWFSRTARSYGPSAAPIWHDSPL